MREYLIPIGILTIFIGMILIIIGTITNINTKPKVAVGGFIGFIPFGFWNEENMRHIVFFLMILMIALYFLFYFMLKIR